jgi:hypothetical protein
MIKDVLLNGGFGINIITKQLRLKLGLPKPKLAPYNLRMVDQTTSKLVVLIRDMQIYVHGIPYLTMFTIIQNNVVDFSYSMLGRPCLKDVKVAHDWGNNIVTIQGNGTIQKIFVIEPKLFSIRTISLPETIQFMKTTDVGIMDTNVKSNISKQGFEVHSIEKKTHGNRYEPKVALEDKVYLDTYYRHQLGSVVMDEIPIDIKA